MKNLFLFSLLIVLSNFANSEDIELYVGDANARAKTKPQVLLMVDTSGSMTTSQSIKTPYNPNRGYKTLGNFSDKSTPHIYYVVGSPTVLPTVDAVSENRRFKAVYNNCSTAKSRLDSVGFYTGRIREYTFQGNTGSWQEFNGTDGTTIKVIDCEDDINLDLANDTAGRAAEHNQNKINGTTVVGYPIDGAGSPLSPVYYDSDVNKADASWGGAIVTLYTDKYLRWEQGTKYGNGNNIGTTFNTRIEIAQRTLANLIDSIPSVQFGLEVYNFNYSSDSTQSNEHGGRIGLGIQEMNATAKAKLLNIIENELHGSGWTPLCESYYEAYRYFAGLSVYYGDNDVNGWNGTRYHDKNLPKRDTSIESGGKYIAPYTGCSNKVFVILITDGEPTNDTATDSIVTALKASTQSSQNPVTANAVSNNYLPVLAEYMFTQDINLNLPGVQTAQLYTVGYSSGANNAKTLLEAAAKNGGGEYYDASDPTKLGSKLQEALSTILSVNTTFTSPSVATNSFDKTQTLESSYYSMFIPNERAGWRGNLKKLKVRGTDQYGRDNLLAKDASGEILSTAKTFWSTSAVADGNDVTKGGVVEMFTNKTKNSRNVYYDTGPKTLGDLTYTNVQTSLGGANNVTTTLGVNTSTEAADYLKWAIGIDVDDADKDGDTDDYRPDLFGDPLHSKPLTINYGGSFNNQDVRIIVGTNAGALHMFKDSGATVDETWAFMPKEFFKNIKKLRDNLPSSKKVYGIDGVIASHIVDANGDGAINSAADKAWIFFGLRRGGSSYYALDVTDPNTKPTLMWKIEGNSTGDFKELGQSWSKPKVGYSKLNIVGGVPKPVVIFGAGYSIAKDASGPGTDDQIGRGIYMVDAETGTLLWSITPGAQAGKNTQFTGFTDSIPSEISTLDSDGDGLIDRLYVGDTGGNIFRIDMPGAKPFDSKTPWTAFKLAELGGVTNADDRRFLNVPRIVRTYFTDTIQKQVGATTTYISQEKPYDAILIGSGDRTTPNSTDTHDKFFLIQDENVTTQPFVSGAILPALDIPTPITLSELADFTGNPYGGTLTNAQIQALDIHVSSKSGWFYDYTSAGEKSTASARAINGIAYFTSFTPGSTGNNTCSLVAGAGSLYAVDLYKGTSFFNTLKTPPTTTTGDARKVDLPPGLPPEITIITSSARPLIPGNPVIVSERDVNVCVALICIDAESDVPTARAYQYILEGAP